MNLELIFVASPARLGDTLAAIETALSPLGYRATGSVYRCSPDEPERISSMSGIRPIAERLNRWDCGGTQLAGERCPIYIDFLVEAQQDRLLVSGSITANGIHRMYDRERSGDRLFQTMASLASAIQADLGVLIYEINAPVAIPPSLWDWLVSQSSPPDLCCARVSSLEGDQGEWLLKQDCRRLEIGEYAIFVDPDFDAIYGPTGG